LKKIINNKKKYYITTTCLEIILDISNYIEINSIN
jgi:hypothetical protein